MIFEIVQNFNSTHKVGTNVPLKFFIRRG